MKGFRYRKLFLIIYGICNGGIVFDLMLTIITAAKAGCGYGPTTCTNTSGGGFLLLNSSSCNSF
ncbi:unnamed protein product [Orchesella dallaii]|uniref:Uncharacterized protein n=1 Tax=Orchesella dallaii TaxID=48710 RepID=A0ABP1QV33_9HEXA